MAELGQTTDPTALIPGSESGLIQLAGAWRARATLADDAAADLRKVAVPEDWSGPASDSYQDRVSALSAKWSTVREAFTAAATAIDEYRGALVWARGQAGVAIEKWERGRRESAGSPLAPISDLDVGGTAFTSSPVDAGASYRAEARAILAAARLSVSATGDSAAAAIRAAANEPDLTPDLWAALGDPSSSPTEALATLSALGATAIPTLLALRPDIARQLAAAAPQDVAAWWTKLGEGQRDALVSALPAVIGNLGGVAFEARDRANRLSLDGQVGAAEAALAEAERPLPWWQLGIPEMVSAHNAQIEAARANLEALENIQGSLSPTNGGPERFLVALTADSPPLAAVSIGDLDHAHIVTYAVPWMGTTTAGMGDWAQASENLAQAQARFDPDHTHAVVAWIGYETPPVPGDGGFDVLDTDYAEAGATKLEKALAGFDATRPDAQVNVLAHSYGTTTASIALTQPGSHVDTFVSIGSAGLPSSIDHASDIHASEVYAGQARDVMSVDPAGGDQWAWTGRSFSNHPVNPVGDSFGAQAFGTDTDSGQSGSPVRDHGVLSSGGGYLDSNTESLFNVALATTGQGDSVTTYVPSPLTPFQEALIDGAALGY